jgi:hypothetical protein
VVQTREQRAEPLPRWCLGPVVGNYSLGVRNRSEELSALKHCEPAALGNGDRSALEHRTDSMGIV